MLSDSNDLLEVFKIITIGDDDKQSYPGQEDKQKFTKHKRKRPKTIQIFSWNKKKKEEKN